jgi:hypothetical protein
MVRSKRRLTVMLTIALGLATTAVAQEAPSTPTFTLRPPRLGYWWAPQQQQQRPRPFDKFKQLPAPAVPSPAAAPALAAPTQDVRVPALIPYESGVARVPSTVCSARVIPMDKSVDPGVTRPAVPAIPGIAPPIKHWILGAEGTCAPNPRAAAPKK